MSDVARDGRRSPFAFFALAAVMCAPLYVVAHFLHGSGLPKNMPVTDFVMAFIPSIAALILTYRSAGSAGVRALLARMVDVRRIGGRRWMAVAAVLPVASLVATYCLMAATGVRFQHQPAVPVGAGVLFAAVFLLAAAGEELGWSGYLIEPLQERYGALGGSVVLGVCWWAFHVPSILQSGQGTTLIVLGMLGAVGTRIVWAWLFNHAGGSVSAMIIVHAVSNICGSYVPSIPTSATAAVTTVFAVALIFFCRPRTLMRAERRPAE